MFAPLQFNHIHYYYTIQCSFIECRYQFCQIQPLHLSQLKCRVAALIASLHAAAIVGSPRSLQKSREFSQSLVISGSSPDAQKQYSCTNKAWWSSTTKIWACRGTEMTLVDLQMQMTTMSCVSLDSGCIIIMTYYCSTTFYLSCQSCSSSPAVCLHNRCQPQARSLLLLGVKQPL